MRCVALLALVLVMMGCGTSGGARYDESYDLLLSERSGVGGPLARDVRWSWATRQQLPPATADTVQLLSQRAASSKSAAEEARDAEAKAQLQRDSLAYLKAAQRARRAEQRASAEAARDVGDGGSVFDIGRAVAWALRSSGFVGDAAPEGTVLHVTLSATTRRDDRIRYRVSMALVERERVVHATTRLLDAWRGEGRAPEGFIEAPAAAEVTGVNAGELALMMRSLAIELHTAVRGTQRAQ